MLLPGLDGTGELFAPLLDALGGTIRASVVRYACERSFDEYMDTAVKALASGNTVLVADRSLGRSRWHFARGSRRASKR